MNCSDNWSGRSILEQTFAPPPLSIDIRPSLAYTWYIYGIYIAREWSSTNIRAPLIPLCIHTVAIYTPPLVGVRSDGQLAADGPGADAAALARGRRL